MPKSRGIKGPYKLGLPVFSTEDDGCEFSPSCLTCPLPKCKYDYQGSNSIQIIRTMLQDRQRLAIMEAEGLTVEMAVVRFGVTKRTIHRMRSRSREENG